MADLQVTIRLEIGKRSKKENGKVKKTKKIKTSLKKKRAFNSL
jgi:hypothetical protein